MTKLRDGSTPFLPDAPEAETTTTIRRIGNGAFLPLTKAMLGPLGLEVGREVRVSVKDGVLTMAAADGAYARTRRAAAAARGRYPKALDILGS
jgi:Growth regulator